MKLKTTKFAIIGFALLSASCAGRVDPLGQGPAISAPGAPRYALPPTATNRIALAHTSAPAREEDVASGSLWRSGPSSLFGDRRANGVGDIVTIVIEIDDQAEMRNQTNRSRDANEGVSVPSFFGLPSLASRVLPGDATLDPAIDASSNSSSSGDGAITREEKIALQIAATVVNVLPNGHMVVAGSQEVRVNHELRDLQVAGIIRREDISRRNTITYEKIADARILYGGRGTISAVQEPRYGQRALDSILPF